MSEFILETQNLGISFGGLKAAQDVNIRIKRNQIYGLIGPNGAGKTTIFNMLTGVYQPTTGKFYLDGEDLTGKGQEFINHKGIARTFQNIRLFKELSVLDNVKVANHGLANHNLLSSIFRLSSHFKGEAKMEEESLAFLKIFIISSLIFSKFASSAWTFFFHKKIIELDVFILFSRFL